MDLKLSMSGFPIVGNILVEGEDGGKGGKGSELKSSEAFGFEFDESSQRMKLMNRSTE